MIKIKLYYSIVTILFLISCVSNKGNDFLSIPAKPIYGSYYDKEIMSNELVAFSSLDCGILMVQRCKLPGEPICQILEEQTGERVGSFGSRGQGPGEFIAAEFIGKTEGDDTLYFVNLPSTVLLYAREEKGADYRYVGSEKIKVKDGCFTTRFCRLSNGYSVATTLSGGKEFFILFDRDFKEIKRFGNHPVRGMTTEANDFMQLQGEMVSYKNSFYFRFLSVRLNRLKNKLLANYLRNRGNDLATVRNSAFCVAILSNNSFICKYNIFFRKYELSVAIL